MISDLIVSFREGDAREEIAGDSIEQRDVVREELGLIHIRYGPQELSGDIAKQ